MYEITIYGTKHSRMLGHAETMVFLDQIPGTYSTLDVMNRLNRGEVVKIGAMETIEIRKITEENRQCSPQK